MHGPGNLAERTHHSPAWAGKGSTLDGLRPHLSASRVPQGLGISCIQWCADRERSLDAIARHLGSATFAVRSDCADEDGHGRSNAGRYATCLGVDGSDRDALIHAIDHVFASYAPLRGTDEVLVQQQISPVRDSAVGFTHALPDGAPYYVLSVASGPRSDNVTRGAGDVDTWYFSRDNPRIEGLPERWRAYMHALIEVEAAMGSSPCEVELAAAIDGQVWLLQARPLAVNACAERPLVALRALAEQRLAALIPSPPLLGMMPDWNPAELLGEHPRPLALTLFDRLVTRRAWHVGRVALGYARVEPPRLLQVHAGRPYIDVRTSFRSLLPASLAPALQERIVEAWCARLRAEPALHDKIEFDITFSALTCGIDAAFESRYHGLLDANERRVFIDALRQPTTAALDPVLTSRLCAGFERDLASAGPGPSVRHLRHGLDRLELRSAVRFATIARQAFAVEALLRSAVDAGALAAARLEELKRTAAATSSLAIPFPREHERSGTFDISVPTRRQLGARAGCAPLADSTPMPSQRPSPMRIGRAESAACRDAFHTIGLDLDPGALFAHYQQVLRARELGKFALARGVSLTLEALAARAMTVGIDRDDAGWLTVDELLADDVSLRSRVDSARARYALEARLRMPLLIDDHRLDVVHHAASQANYLGRGRVGGRPVTVDAHTDPDLVPVHAIIAIASADPGFDWLFQRRPAALLTAFGGPNSHMAIRCAEHGVPAVLGLGPDAFRRVVASDVVTVDFDARAWTNH